MDCFELIYHCIAFNLFFDLRVRIRVSVTFFILDFVTDSCRCGVMEIEERVAVEAAAVMKVEAENLVSTNLILTNQCRWGTLCISYRGAIQVFTDDFH